MFWSAQSWGIHKEVKGAYKGLLKDNMRPLKGIWIRFVKLYKSIGGFGYYLRDLFFIHTADSTQIKVPSSGEGKMIFIYCAFVRAYVFGELILSRAAVNTWFTSRPLVSIV